MQTSPVIENPLLQAALEYITLGLKVVPCIGKAPSDRIKKGDVSKIRKKPINDKNANFYFGTATHIAILTGNKHEVLDIDSKYDLTGNLNTNYLKALEVSLPEETFRKLVIVKTPSDGRHIHYRCHQIGSSHEIAKRFSIDEERKKGEREKCLIEIKGEGGQVTCPGSPGYEFIQNNFSEIPLITVEERETIISIAASFDKIKKPELKGIAESQKNAGDAPWVVFNRQHDYNWMLQELLNSGFSKAGEDDTRIYIKREGSLAKSSGAIWKEMPGED